MSDLIITCYGTDTRHNVDNLIDSAIGERLVSAKTFAIWDEKDMKFSVHCENETDKNNLVNYIYQWLSDDDSERVKFFTKKDRPDISFKEVATNKSSMDKLLEDWK